MQCESDRRVFKFGMEERKVINEVSNIVRFMKVEKDVFFSRIGVDEVGGGRVSGVSVRVVKVNSFSREEFRESFDDVRRFVE